MDNNKIAHETFGAYSFGQVQRSIVMLAHPATPPMLRRILMANYATTIQSIEQCRLQFHSAIT